MSRIQAHEQSVLNDSTSQNSLYLNGKLKTKSKNKNVDNLPPLKQSLTYLPETELLSSGGYLRHKGPKRSNSPSKFNDRLPNVSSFIIKSIYGLFMIALKFIRSSFTICFRFICDLTKKINWTHYFDLLIFIS